MPRAPPARTTACRARTVNGAAAPRRVGADPALDADGAAVLDQDPARLDPGAYPRTGGDRPRQVADVHAALRVDRAAERAGAALHAVPALREIGPPPTPSAAAPSIASRPLRPIRAGSSGVTRSISSASAKSASRSRAQSMPKRVAQSRAPPGGAEAGARVDDGRAADRPRHRHGIGGLPGGDRQPAVAIEARRSRRAGRRGSCRGRGGRRPRAPGRRGPPRPGSPRRPRRPRPSRPRRRRIPRPRRAARCRRASGAGSGSAPSASPQREVEADPRAHLRRHRVAERREELRHQQQVELRRRARAFEPCRKRSARPRSRRLKRRGNGSHSKARRPSRSCSSGGGTAREEVGDRRRRRRRRARPRAGRRSPGAIASQIALRVRRSAAPSPGAAFSPGAIGRSIRPASDVEPERQQDQRAVDEGAEQVGEDLFLKRKKASEVSEEAALPAARSSSSGR